MSSKRPPPQKLEFHARIWSSGNRLLIPITQDLANIYDLEGKFVKVDIEVLGIWKLPSQKS